jgi:preprotein translocase subunit SecY
MMGGNRQWIPAALWVMPIILLRLSCLYLLLWLVSKSDASQSLLALLVYVRFWYNLVFATNRCTFFYTAITVPTNKMSDDLKSGGFIPVLDRG